MKILLITVFNILEDDEVRQSIKIYSSWPTFPQLYIKSDLIGGLDIVKELVETSEFQELFLDWCRDKLLLLILSHKSSLRW